VIVGITGEGDRLPLRALLTAVLGRSSDGTVIDGDAELTVDFDGQEATVIQAGRDIPMFTATDVELRLSGTSFVLAGNGSETPVSLRLLGEQSVTIAVAALVVARELVIPLPVAVEALGEVRSGGHWRMEVTQMANSVTIINDAHDATTASMSSALRALAQFTSAGRRSVAVLGEFRSDPGEFVEAHDALGRLVVRLNIGKLVAVGHSARHIQSAAGLEGSWDGESVIVANNEQAYDLLRDEIRAGDVVLVKAATAANLGPLGDRLATGERDEATS
jgi:UDP-N-acetylmuramoyl-tripeptide--D-alanyl-D-alanine ligase